MKMHLVGILTILLIIDTEILGHSLRERLMPDPVRRALWARSVPRENWAPTHNSFLGEQVPTKDIENDGSTKNDINEISSIIQSGEYTNEEASDDDKNTEVNIETVTTNDASEHHPITSSANISSITESQKREKEENEKWKEQEQELLRIFMSWEITQLYDYPRLNHIPARITGPKELRINEDRTIILTCIIKLQDLSPSNVTWYHDGAVIDFDPTISYPRPRVVSQTEKFRFGTISKLLITDVQPNDSGNYTCALSKVIQASISVDVPNEDPATMQNGGTGDVNRRLVLLLIFLVDMMFW